MVIALIVFLFFLYIVIPKKDSQKSIRLFVTISTFAMVLLSGFRNMAVGNDTYAYLRRFHEIRRFSWNEIISQFWIRYFNPSLAVGKDPGYSVFAKLLSYVTDNEQVFLLVIAMALLIPLSLFIIRHSSRIEDALFAYVFYTASYFTYLPNSAVRQSLALAFIIIAYMRLEDNRSLLFFLFVIVASTFHQSAIGVLLVYPLYKIRSVKGVYIGCFFLFVLMLFYYNQVGEFLASSNEIYGGYEAGGFYARGNERPFMVFFVFLIIYSIGLLTTLNKSVIVGNNKILYIGTGLSVAILPLIWYDPSCIRLNAYFGVYVSCFVPFCLRRYDTAVRRIIVLMLYIMLFLKTTRTPFDYKFFWQEMELNDRYSSVAPRKLPKSSQTYLLT